MLQFFAATVVMSLLFAHGVFSRECFPQPNCVGSSFTVSSAKECCAETEEGMSYSEGGTCTVTQCIVHGFANVSYTVVEAEQLSTTFGPNVKGNSSLGTNIGGEIIAEAGTDTTQTDFALRETPVILVSGFSDVRLDASNDDVTLEIGDTVILKLDPTAADIVNLVEGQGQFLRDTATVTILDNDLLNINFQESDHSFDEAEAVSGISVRYRSTQSSFRLHLFPVNITEGKRRVGDFITISETTSAATAGKDFTDDPSVVTIPKSPDTTGVFDILANFTTINDDEIDEFDQSFILVAEIGDDVPDSFVCFQRQATGGRDCMGRRAGATEIRIVDNDDMVIGFTQRSQTVSESQAPPKSDRFMTPLDVRAMIISEKNFQVNFKVLEREPRTEIEATNLILDPPDALFGTREDAGSDITDTRNLVLLNDILETPLVATIIDDFRPEGEEFFTIDIEIPDSGDRDNFECTTDEEVPPPGGFFCRHTIFIVDNDERFRVAFVETMYTVVESEGRVEVCVNLTRPEIDILDETVQVDVFHYDSSVYISPNPVLATPDVINTFTRVYPRLPMTDYEEQTIGINLIRDTKITATRRIICYNQTIYNDMRLEVSEYTGLGLVPNALSTVLTEVEPMYNESSILIIDDDVAVVGLEKTFYSVSEDVGVVEVCAIVYSPTIDCPIAFPFDVGLSTLDNTAVAPMDYVALSEILMFGACQTRSCKNVTIVDDLVDEPEEFFRVLLTRTTGLDSRITLNPVEGRIVIMDNDVGITVGYELTVYTTTEGQGQVELCAVIFEPDTGGAPRPFELSFSTEDGSAESPEDYGGVTDVRLDFVIGQNRSCHIVNINDDDICENNPNERFFSNLVLGGGVQPIIVEPPQTQVIIDDSNEPECGGITVGYEFSVYNTDETAGMVQICAIIYEPMTGGAPREFVVSSTTRDGSAIAGADYVSQSVNLMFTPGSTRECHTVSILQDDDCEQPPENFFADLELESGTQPININISTTRVIIDDSGELECRDDDVFVNDTLTGDPLMTVPIWNGMDVDPNDPPISLCYEVHGAADKFFNLVSDSCVTVNAHYWKSPIASLNIDLNVVDAIGVRAVSNNFSCVNIRVGLQGCQATVNGADVNLYRSNGITVRKYSNRVRIAVPNCEDTDLVMYVFCKRGRTEDPKTWVYFDFDFIRFVVMRGLNLDERSHGIIGQFWNIPVNVEENTGDFNGVARDDDYIVTVNYPGSSRRFVGLRYSVTWEFERRVCLYVGNSQAGPLGETVVPNESVIQGTYLDYEVDSMFSPDFMFSHFDESNCR